MPRVKKQEKSVSESYTLSVAMASRVRRILEQTGLSFGDLIQKWTLQEESMISLTRKSVSKPSDIQKNISEPKSKGPRSRRKKATQSEAQGEPGDRTSLFKKAEDLKKGGASLVKIASLFNEENIPTTSGTGKWYGSSIALLLKKRK
jgi:hypothetical protein